MPFSRDDPRQYNVERLWKSSGGANAGRRSAIPTCRQTTGKEPGICRALFVSLPKLVQCVKIPSRDGYLIRWPGNCHGLASSSRPAVLVRERRRMAGNMLESRMNQRPIQITAAKGFVPNLAKQVHSRSRPELQYLRSHVFPTAWDRSGNQSQFRS